ncbi:hypothetical protein CTI12_AA487870 [Artemisia annua]|uniref:Hybrid signal transduction histidine kinase M n=1 Tax=Artemisia annua TaxID=35608 RepID=A0A2U1LIF0_ARTAN|nr:hypothetical protein CTI12_AA487870 [Artemisia annua]
MAGDDDTPPPPPPTSADKLILCSITNKEARAIKLDNELCSIMIGTMSINDYCTKIKSMVDRLKNLGSSVSEKNLVIYAVNGLDSRFSNIVKIIRHCEPLLTFETARNMLLLEESTLNEQAGSSFNFDSSSSSATILMTTKSTEPKGNTNAQFNKVTNFNNCVTILIKGRVSSVIVPGHTQKSWAPLDLYHSRMTHQTPQPILPSHIGYQPIPQAYTTPFYTPRTQQLYTPQQMYTPQAQNLYQTQQPLNAAQPTQ